MSYINTRSMKITGIIILVIDALLLLSWTAGQIYIICNLEEHCFTELFIVHFLILIHFALAIFITIMLNDIIKEEQKNKGNKTPVILSFYNYSPLPWIFVSILSFLGDVILLAYAIKAYIIAHDDPCMTSRKVHIAYDTIATLVSLLSIIWFIAFSFFVLRHPKNFKIQENENKLDKKLQQQQPLYLNNSFI